MSHTSTFKMGPGNEVTVIHNMDWSGIATVVWKDSEGDHRAEIPGSLLMSLGGAVALDHLKRETIGFLEMLERWPAAMEQALEEQAAGV